MKVDEGRNSREISPRNKTQGTTVVGRRGNLLCDPVLEFRREKRG